MVAIIAILAALLAPGLKGAREQAKSMECVSNLRQLGIALIQYSDESRGVLPKYYDTTPIHDYGLGGDNKAHWAFRLEPYIGHVGRTGASPYVGDEMPQKFADFNPVLRCRAAYPIVTTSLNGEVTMYMINASLASHMNAASPIISTLRAPSRTILLADSAVNAPGNAPGQDPRYWFGMYGAAWEYNPFIYPEMYARHAYAPRVNCCFLDGHVENLPSSTVTNTMISP